MRPDAAVHRDLVLVGGGHSHALALRMLAMKPIDGLRVTLISPQSYTPYSGMLPGLIAGHYTFEQAHIDLVRLCGWAGVRFIQAEVTWLDPEARRLAIDGRPDVAYDVVSLDIGSQPELASVPGAADYAVPVKPVSNFWIRWTAFLRKLKGNSSAVAISLVGGGAGSVELALAMAHKLAGSNVTIDLWCAGGEILSGYNRRARNRVLEAMGRYGVNVHYDSRVIRVEKNTLHFEPANSPNAFRDNAAYFDEVFWCTGASAAPWVARSGLAVDAQGFLAVQRTLQSTDDKRVFAAGDIAAQQDDPRPKAGVFAVRQAPTLAANLRAVVLDKPLKPFRPQARFLSLVSLGDESAVADRGLFSASGAWVWRWKDRIDTKFMEQFEKLPTMMPSKSWGRVPEAVRAEQQAPCGGCGAKVGADVLQIALASLAQRFPEQLEVGADDAAAIPLKNAKSVLQSVDVLRQLVDDPWQMGRIAANHALSDLYASAAQPLSALAVITLPFSGESIQQRDLQQILAGALFEFSKVGCVLNGGHTLQGPELSVGFVVNGAVQEGELALSKYGGKAGDALVLTKALGTGVVFAAHMQRRARGDDVEAAMQAMLQSNAGAAHKAREAGVHASTDVTGFGLMGHLQEMLTADLSATIYLSSLPALPGALQYFRTGVQSTMQAANMRSVATHMPLAGGYDEARLSLAFDPQTSGGLLLACPQHQAEQLVASLTHEGLVDATVIGALGEASAGAASAIEICA